MEARAPAVRWYKEWVPQDLISTGGKCSLLKWVTEDTLKTQEKCKEPENQELEPETTAEVLFLCSYEGCGKTFLDAGALRKHALNHGGRQYICHYDGCGKKFLDSSKLKRHFLTHTGERHFICPTAGCGKAFSLDFNLRSHMKIHSPENYHVCPYEDCGKKYTHENKLNAHIKAHHGKNTGMDTVKHSTPIVDKTHSVLKTPAAVSGSASSDRPFACPHVGCGKDYIHEYKLNLHLKKEHPGHNVEENGKYHAPPAADRDMDEASEHETLMKTLTALKNIKRDRPSPAQQMPPSKVPKQKGSSSAPTNIGTVKKQWPIQDMYEDDSEETEEDREDAENDDDDDDDDEETEDED